MILVISVCYRIGMPKRGQYPKYVYWKGVLRRVRAGDGFDIAVGETKWNAAQWRKWISLNEERESELVLAERDGTMAKQANLQARAVAAYDKWLALIEKKLANDEAIGKDDVKELRLLMETKVKGLRPRKLKAQDGDDEEEVSSGMFN